MPNTRLIKSRIKSAQNIAKITKAMEMVSASKMRRAQDQVTASRPYAEKLHSVLQKVGQFSDPSLHPLLQTPVVGRPLLVIVSTDRGLAGGLNTNLFKAALQFKDTHPNLSIIVVGRKAQDFARRMGWEVEAAFINMPEKVGFQDILPIAQMVREGFLEGQYSQVNIVHMEFISTLSQHFRYTQLLPLKPQEISTPETEAELVSKDYLFEPTPQAILDWLLPYYVEVEIYQLFLDARASEHSARMVAMQNASNNAKDVVGSLRLEYNKGRQAAITQELLEITTAGMSVQEQAN